MDIASKVNQLSRSRIVYLLEEVTGTACYDDESTDLLRETLVESVNAGDVEECMLC